MTEVSRDRPRTVTGKVMSVLNAFRPAATELSLNELAHRSGLPLSTTYRIATELVELGALEPGVRVGYRIGLRLWETGSLAARGLGLREIAVPFMQDLYQATRENVHLAVLDGFDVLYVEKITGRESMPIRSQEARRLPLHATGVGKALLAYSPEALVRQVLMHGLERYTVHTIVTPGRLMRELDRIRQSGVAVSRQELTIGSVSVASPVFGPDGSVVAAVSIAGRTSRLNPARLGAAVRTAAIGVSRSLGARAGDTPDGGRDTRRGSGTAGGGSHENDEMSPPGDPARRQRTGASWPADTDE